MTDPGYAFRRTEMADLPLLRAWQQAPHVRAWWDADEPYAAADLADDWVSRWIVSHAGEPFAFMQDYRVHGWPDHPFAHLPSGARGIDQYIGLAEMLGQGHGPAFIGLRMKALFAEGAPVIVTDPHPENTRAIAAYQKLGFTPDGPPRMTDWGLVQPMLAWG